ncbi:AfsR/SARP family transcriptional regulator [Nocardia stercoris]|uniref:AfsR/SARP family transcriptional regulator n=1 Tax=Nocardia stercoris TaxID=2483361 RepID=UPI0011C41CF8|nr:AfsR/SARP family transcriptional regulator [Nocardia stercoris]
MRIAVLGEVTVAGADGERRRVGGARLRTLLMVLADRPGRTVSCEKLIDGIWGERLPAEPVNALQTLVKRLRALLPDDIAVESVSGGYQLRVDPDEVDLHRFTRLGSQGTALLRSGEFRDAAAVFESALALWDGTITPNTVDIPDLAWQLDRIRELRLDAVEARAEACVALGRAGEVVAQLEAELRRNPLRESLAVRLVHVLTAIGRYGRAREVVAATRELLRAELGVDASPELLRAVGEHPHRGTYRGVAPRPAAQRRPTRVSRHTTAGIRTSVIRPAAQPIPFPR